MAASAGIRLRRRLLLLATLAAGFACLPGLYAATPVAMKRATPVTVEDDAGHRVSLPSAARRIVSLAPHATELLFAAGAGGRIVGTSDYSDYPPEARDIPSVGGAASIDVERIVALHPDLVVAWRGGNPSAQIAMLRRLGLPVFESGPRRLDDIASSLERLGRLAGTPAAGAAAARAFRERLQGLRDRYRGRPPVAVFYQVWADPLMTFGDGQILSEAARLCGGANAFSSLSAAAPTVSIEAVLAARPEAIFAVGGTENSLAGWRRFAGLPAVARGNLFTLPADWASRPGPRILDGAEALCRDLDIARSKRRATH